MVPFVVLSSLSYWQGLAVQLGQLGEPSQLKTDETSWKLSTAFFFSFALGLVFCLLVAQTRPQQSR